MGIAKRKRALAQALKPLVDDFEIGQSGNNHFEVRITVGDASRKMHTAATPSCPHALNQFIRDVKRAICEMTQRPSPAR